MKSAFNRMNTRQEGESSYMPTHLSNRKQSDHKWSSKRFISSGWSSKVVLNRTRPRCQSECFILLLHLFHFSDCSSFCLCNLGVLHSTSWNNSRDHHDTVTHSLLKAHRVDQWLVWLISVKYCLKHEKIRCPVVTMQHCNANKTSREYDGDLYPANGQTVYWDREFH